jgi:sucrose 6(F)-phosphate phosphorylase
MPIKNQVQLITYPDSLGGDLKKLNEILLKYFMDIFKGGIHILPPYPSSGDRGFAPLTYLEIEPKFGSWEDIEIISRNFDILLDLMVNHISRQSEYFKDFIKNGRSSKYGDMFLTLDKIWPYGNPVKEDLDKIFLRRLVPFSSFKIENSGIIEKVWTTFGKQDPSEQIDIDIYSKTARQLIFDFLQNFSKHNIKMVRLDAVGYVIKKSGTSCFFVEPEIYQFIDWITKIASDLDIELLPEVHSHFSYQIKLAEHGNWIYDFVLPYTILETLLFKSSHNLCNYLKNRPSKQFTMLDCHDGIPVKPDMNDLYKSKDAKKLIEICLERQANLSYVFSEKYKDPDGFDVHQIRCSYYSMLNCDDNSYLAARAIQFFAPGIPQVYYVGLLAGKNDIEKVKATGEGREINRHNFSEKEIETALRQNVVQRLLKLIRFRNEYPAFNGQFKVIESNDVEIKLSWVKDKFICNLNIDLNTYNSFIIYCNEEGETVKYNI